MCGAFAFPANVILDTPNPATDETQEQQMTHRPMSLMDVLAPPGNRWLMELSRRKYDLPPGVQIVRFNDEDENQAANDDEAEVRPRRRTKAG